MSKKRHESGHWHPERWRDNPVRVRRYLLHLDRAAHTAAIDLVGFHFANLVHGELRNHRAAIESERILHELGIATIGDMET